MKWQFYGDENMIYRICVTKYGYANVKADSADEAIMIAERQMTDCEFDWSDFDEAEIVEEFE